MKYDHAVKFSGRYYKAGEEVLIVETADASRSSEHEEEARKPGRPKKAAGQ